MHAWKRDSDGASPHHARVLSFLNESSHSAARVAATERTSQLTYETEYHLYKMISEHLKSHPTTPETPKRLQIQGMPPQKEIIPPAIPRGFKIGTILPLHSPALSGGGVSENMFKDMVCTTFSQLSVPNYSSTSPVNYRGSFETLWR